MKAYQPITDYFIKSSVKTCIFDPCDFLLVWLMCYFGRDIKCTEESNCTELFI